MGCAWVVLGRGGSREGKKQQKCNDVYVYRFSRFYVNIGINIYTLYMKMHYIHCTYTLPSFSPSGSPCLRYLSSSVYTQNAILVYTYAQGRMACIPTGRPAPSWAWVYTQPPYSPIPASSLFYFVFIFYREGGIGIQRGSTS